MAATKTPRASIHGQRLGALKKPTKKPARPAAPRPAPRSAAPASEPAAPSSKKTPPVSKKKKRTSKTAKLNAAQTAPIFLPTEPSRQARETAVLAVQAALEKKALDIEIIDVAGKVDYADLLVLMTGTSDRHVASIVQGIEEDLRKQKIRAIAVEGMSTAQWVLIDFADIVIHVFQEDSRGLYDLSSLWTDASRIPLPQRVQPGT